MSGNKMTMFEWFVRRLAGQLRKLPGSTKRFIVELTRFYLCLCDKDGHIEYGLSFGVHILTLWLLAMLTIWTGIVELLYAGVLGALIGASIGAYTRLHKMYEEEVN